MDIHVNTRGPNGRPVITKALLYCGCYDRQGTTHSVYAKQVDRQYVVTVGELQLKLPVIKVDGSQIVVMLDDYSPKQR